MGKSVPFHTAEDLEVTLAQQGESYCKQEVHSVLTFPDTEDHRWRILWFLLGNDCPEGPQQPLLDLLTPYAAAGTVTMPLVHEQFLIQREDKERGARGHRSSRSG